MYSVLSFCVFVLFYQPILPVTAQPVRNFVDFQMAVCDPGTIFPPDRSVVYCVYFGGLHRWRGARKTLNTLLMDTKELEDWHFVEDYPFNTLEISQLSDKRRRFTLGVAKKSNPSDIPDIIDTNFVRFMSIIESNSAAQDGQGFVGNLNCYGGYDTEDVPPRANYFIDCDIVNLNDSLEWIIS